MKSTEDPRIKQFWDGYFETIRLFRIPENRHSWYQKHVESFIRYLPKVRLLDRKPEHIEQWLTQAGRNADVSTTMIYTHVVGRGDQGVRSPLDLIGN